ncbi:MAG: type I methionyl aminopeptidase [Clostridia bacterium]|nr:type I methionyl aminopeptidase [Clostridia bacterium]
MIFVKNSEQLKLMKTAGRITGEALAMAGELVKEGVSTKFLDDKIRHYIEKCGAKPSFLGYGGFPGSACISINDEVIHGIPSNKRILKEGDIVKIDVGAFIGGFHGDSANTFAVGKVSEDAEQLIRVTKESFEAARAAMETENARIGDVGSAVEEYVKKYGYSVVREYTGHGIGHDLHEDPSVPNYGTPGRGAKICVGMVLAIEPMINAGVSKVRLMPDKWTVKTADGKLSAHYEHTVALTEDGAVCLTKV